MSLELVLTGKHIGTYWCKSAHQGLRVPVDQVVRQAPQVRVAQVRLVQVAPVVRVVLQAVVLLGLQDLAGPLE